MYEVELLGFYITLVFSLHWAHHKPIRLKLMANTRRMAHIRPFMFIQTQILVCGIWYASYMQMAWGMFAVPPTCTRIWYVNCKRTVWCTSMYQALDNPNVYFYNNILKVDFS